ncbi:ribosome-binding factor A [Dictyobacter sp. S3.2.2.5]|uniref:Ribosome-binding factor A n=1 Tax=Dictyobacter halimunensis TaxID=3026934 RepID=A0ABQ6FZY3_9CHLR|nr:ribosome-binding factor A [Dictyobacter sp. S3.2.2.5]
MPNTHRQEKLGELMTADLSELIRTRLKDPRVGFASITRVEVSGDLRHAKVFVSVMGTPEDQKATMQGLKNASGFLRHEMASRLTLRYMPELSFKLDTSIEEGARILSLINQVEQEDREKANTEQNNVGEPTNVKEGE